MNQVHQRIQQACVASLLVGSLMLSGCANRPKPLYDWSVYQVQVYEHFKAQGKGPEEQVLAMEAGLEKMRANASTPPPGYNAHLGLLYASLGRDEQAFRSFQVEKKTFPESAQYIDFLMSKTKK